MARNRGRDRTRAPSANVARPAEVRALVGLNLLCSAISFLALIAPITDHRIHHPAILIGAIFAGIAVLVFLVAPGHSRSWLFAGVVADIGVISSVLTVAHSGENTAIVSFALVWMAIYAAALFPPRQVVAIVVAGAAGSVGGLASGDLRHWLAVWCITNVTTISASLVIGYGAAQLRREAETDELTGILNRRGFAKAASVARAIAERASIDLTIVIIDLDDFKAVNDASGHAEGDRMLIEAADAWEQQLRDGDLLSRFGGDEFVVLLPATSGLDLDTVLGRLRRAHPIRWTAGSALWRDGEELEACLRRADAELYTYKLDKRPREALS